MNTPQEIGKANETIIQWAVRAASEHVAYCKDSGEEPDTEWCMGLWQSFQYDFPKESTLGDYDLAIWLASTTYRSVVQALAEQG